MAFSFSSCDDSTLLSVLRGRLDAHPLWPRLLQRAITHGNVALLESYQLAVLARDERDDTCCLQLGVHYSSLITGCSCIDDPSPLSELPEYLRIQLQLDADGEILRLDALDD
ncbi:MAG: hypothetical protein PHI49_02060 [Halothiobacillaceae bacterium]|nr:hypothetical protein [Halothiobacillaceae bacterium]